MLPETDKALKQAEERKAKQDAYKERILSMGTPKDFTEVSDLLNYLSHVKNMDYDDSLVVIKLMSLNKIANSLGSIATSLNALSWKSREACSEW